VTEPRLLPVTDFQQASCFLYETPVSAHVC
jgi:hypothetical protein